MHQRLGARTSPTDVVYVLRTRGGFSYRPRLAFGYQVAAVLGPFVEFPGTIIGLQLPRDLSSNIPKNTRGMNHSMTLHSPTLGGFLVRKEITRSGELDLDQHPSEYAVMHPFDCNAAVETRDQDEGGWHSRHEAESRNLTFKESHLPSRILHGWIGRPDQARPDPNRLFSRLYSVRSNGLITHNKWYRIRDDRGL